MVSKGFEICLHKYVLVIQFPLLFFLVVCAVISSPKGPAPNSEYEHSSIPATIKKMFNLSSNYLTHRDAWAGTFEQVVGELTSPRTDCPGTYFVFYTLYLTENYSTIEIIWS